MEETLCFRRSLREFLMEVERGRIGMTDRLYYTDSHIQTFEAEVQQCIEDGDGADLILDRTAFFPGGGGQACDTGVLNEQPVRQVYEKNGIIYHRCPKPLPVGSKVVGRIDWETRFRRMQAHSGEHIVSGTVHRDYGWDNVGFHMGSDAITIDFDGEMTCEQLESVERKANEAIWRDTEIHTYILSGKEVRSLEYRSKLELMEDVRIVEIDEVDRCACCAPHVHRTGEIGSIKILSSMRHRGGTRVEMVAGQDAFLEFQKEYKNAVAVSRMLSSKRLEIAEATAALLRQAEELKLQNGNLSRKYVQVLAETMDFCDGNRCLLENGLPEAARRELVNALKEKTSGYVAVLAGSDTDGYHYIIGSSQVDLKKARNRINEGIAGKGGGSTEMLQGSAIKHFDEISEFILSDNER